VLGLLGVALLVAGSVALRARVQPPALRQVLITSTPPGATVMYGETVLGKTPWAGDLPAQHEVELVVSAPGFQAVKRTLLPGELAPVEVSLKKSLK
jgi:hypothetical protein